MSDVVEFSWHVSGSDVVNLANYIQRASEFSQYEAGRNRACYLMS